MQPGKIFFGSLPVEATLWHFAKHVCPSPAPVVILSAINGERSTLQPVQQRSLCLARVSVGGLVSSGCSVAGCRKSCYRGDSRLTFADGSGTNSGQAGLAGFSRGSAGRVTAILAAAMLLFLGLLAGVCGWEAALDASHLRKAREGLAVIHSTVRNAYTRHQSISLDFAVHLAPRGSKSAVERAVEQYVFQIDSLPPIKQWQDNSELVMAYDRRFEAESEKGPFTVLFLSGSIRELPRSELEDALQGRTPPPSATQSQKVPGALESENAAEAEALQNQVAQRFRIPVRIQNETGMTLRLIPTGQFRMGSSAESVRKWTEAIRRENQGSVPAKVVSILESETPQRTVSITKPFYMAVSEVTVAQFRQFTNATGFRTTAERGDAAQGGRGGVVFRADFRQTMDRNVSWKAPGFPLADLQPVVLLTISDAEAFCAWLSDREGATYRLPNEREWEFACRALATTEWSCRDDVKSIDAATWSGANSQGRIYSVATRRPNAFGLYDMHGNVGEWCRPVGPVSSPISRGGSAFVKRIYTRSAARVKLTEHFRRADVGFRVVRSISPAPAR